MGHKLRLPVMLAPVGALESFDPGAGGAVVRGAGHFGAAHMLSSVSEPGLEKVAEAAPDRAAHPISSTSAATTPLSEDRIERAIASGYAAFCPDGGTTAHYSRRERDLAKRFVRANRRDVSGREFQMALDWRTVKTHQGQVQDPRW